MQIFTYHYVFEFAVMMAQQSGERYYLLQGMM